MIDIIPNWHPFFVHFTIALFSVACVLFLIQKPIAETEIGDNIYVVARFLLYLGVIMSVLTLLAGWHAFNTVDHDTPSHVAMLDHRLWGIVTFVIFFIAALWLLASSSMDDSASVIFIVFVLIGGGLLLTAGYKGSELVYKHGLGVQSLPNAGNHDHSAGHGHHSSDLDEALDTFHGGMGAHDSGHSHDELVDGHHVEDTFDAPVIVDKDGISKQAVPAVRHHESFEDGHDHIH